MPGIPDDIGAPPPDSASSGIGVRVADGSNGVAVACSVKAQTGGAFTLQGAVSSSDPRVSVSIMGIVDTTGVGTAIIALSAQALPADVMSPTGTPCTLEVVASSGLAVKPGAIWARFRCATLVSAPTYNCAASGEVVLENCTK